MIQVLCKGALAQFWKIEPSFRFPFEAQKTMVECLKGKDILSSRGGGHYPNCFSSLLKRDQL